MIHTLTANMVFKSQIERNNECQGCKGKLQAKVLTSQGKSGIKLLQLL